MKNINILALICLVFSIASFIPLVIFNIDSSLWLFTFILAPIGAILALWGSNYFLLIINVIMFFAVFLIMYGLEFIQKYFSV
ncbi:hypothetical protein [Kurthia sibirica]|uniref:DUF2651 domain-containing protein n=1 Tax=Kurthia sibirica TaxID=202750 RepID=A0A2U3AP55_9BACL|nr:hypothetical protein [Kurthia sibirica]PWI26311.1 hypothetical protein DEX24_02960 [Kurthia sibirica]GEK35020.1 hypothetical protein KSI01_25530 [Kurthia sibirica]